MANHFHLVWLLPLFGSVFSLTVEAASFQDGRITQIVGDVRMSRAGGTPARLQSGASLNGGSIHSGPAARAEIAFRDQTLIRLGDKTDLSIDAQSRTFELSSGAALTQVPSGVGRTTLNVHSISATATGATLVVECMPQAYTKFISLDGTSRLCLRKHGWSSDCVLLRPGQMLIAKPEPKSLPEVVDVDLNHLLETSQFITEFPPLPAQARLTKAAQSQQKDKTHGGFADTDLVIRGRGTLVNQKTAGAHNPNAANAQSITPRPTATPTPVTAR